MVLRELTLASLVIAPSRNNIDQEVLLLLADEYRPTCPFSMTNPGSLTMGFAEADTRHSPSGSRQSRSASVMRPHHSSSCKILSSGLVIPIASSLIMGVIYQRGLWKLSASK